MRPRIFPALTLVSLTRQARVCLSVLLLLMLFSQHALVVARASMTIDPSDRLAQLVQADTCRHGLLSSQEELPLPCEHCITQCCLLFLDAYPPALVPASSHSHPLDTRPSYAFQTITQRWQRPHVRAPPLAA